MRKIICALSIIAILFSLCACGKENKNNDADTNASVSISQHDNKKLKNKTKITADDFKSIMQSLGYSITEGTYGSSGNVLWPEYDTCLVASKEGGTSFIYCSCNDLSTAETNMNLVVEMGDMIANSYDGTQKNNETGKNYSTYIFDNGPYIYISRVDNTVIYSSTILKLKNNVNEVMNKLGY